MLRCISCHEDSGYLMPLTYCDIQYPLDGPRKQRLTDEFMCLKCLAGMFKGQLSEETPNG